MCEAIKLFLPRREAKYFCAGDWTTQISLKGFANSGFWHDRCGSVMAGLRPGHPRQIEKQDVDARDKRGHGG
jgi:hypothetical protein